MSPELATLQITINGVQQDHPLAPFRYRIGRSSRADIHLRDHRVSRSQAILLYQPDGHCLIIDGDGKVGSQNGTFVNGVRVKYRRLEDRDVLFLGSPGVTAQIYLPRQSSCTDDDPFDAEILLPDDVPTEIGVGALSQPGQCPFTLEERLAASPVIQLFP